MYQVANRFGRSRAVLLRGFTPSFLLLRCYSSVSGEKSARSRKMRAPLSSATA